MRTIFKGTLSEVTNLKNILENANIQAFIINENMAVLEPWVAIPARLNVDDNDYETALKIIEDFQNGSLMS